MGEERLQIPVPPFVPYVEYSFMDQLDWNTSLSLANWGKHGLVAYHYPGAYPRWPLYPLGPPAEIGTIAFDLK